MRTRAVVVYFWDENYAEEMIFHSSLGCFTVFVHTLYKAATPRRLASRICATRLYVLEPPYAQESKRGMHGAGSLLLLHWWKESEGAVRTLGFSKLVITTGMYRRQSLSPANISTTLAPAQVLPTHSVCPQCRSTSRTWMLSWLPWRCDVVAAQPPHRRVLSHIGRFRSTDSCKQRVMSVQFERTGRMYERQGRSKGNTCRCKNGKTTLATYVMSAAVNGAQVAQLFSAWLGYAPSIPIISMWGCEAQKTETETMLSVYFLLAMIISSIVITPAVTSFGGSL